MLRSLAVVACLVALGASCSSGGGGKSTGAGGSGGGGGTGAQPTLFPLSGADNVCPDPPLRLTFSGPPTLGSAGKIQVFDDAQPDTAIATVDMDPMAYMPPTPYVDAIGGANIALPRPVWIDGNDAVVYLRSRGLDYGHTYHVTVEPGAITGPDGAQVAVSDAATWRFTTAAAAPASLSAVTVALDGSGPFCSLQRVFDTVPAANTEPVVITLAPGTYHEVLHFTGKNNITVRGQDRKTSIIAAINNNALNGGTATRSLVGIDNSADIVFETLTIHNLTLQGGTQAEALRLQRCTRCIVRDADVLSFQDTLLFSGQVYMADSYVEGNVDFVWGTGTAYFKNSEIKTVGRAGYNVMARNTGVGYGYIFVDCKLTSDPNITNNVLGRIDATAYPASNVAYLNCEMGSHISPGGWLITPPGVDTSLLRLWEYQSHDSTGAAIDVSQRVMGSRQLTADEAAMLRDPAVVFAGWVPPAP